jgi:hypothetical protein
MGVEVKGAGDGVVIADRGCNDCYNRKSSVSSRILQKTRRLPALIE